MATQPIELEDEDLRAIDETIRQTHQPAGNFHTPMRKNKYISGSKLTKLPPSDLAMHILAEDKGFADNGDKEYGFLGNRLCDATFEAWKISEIRIEAEIPDTDWIVRIHPDRVIERPGTKRIFFGEHKAHMNRLPDEKLNAAMRQPALALALAWRKVKANGGSYTFPIAEYEQARRLAAGLGTAPPWTWPEGWTPGGTISVIVRNKPPYLRIGKVLSESDLESVADEYLAAARAVVQAVEKNDLEITHQFELAHPWLVGGAIAKGDDELDDWLQQYVLLKERVDEDTAALSALSGKIKPSMMRMGLKSRAIGNKSVRIEPVAGRRTAKVEALVEAGLTQYITQGAPYERLTIEEDE